MPLNHSDMTEPFSHCYMLKQWFSIRSFYLLLCLVLEFMILHLKFIFCTSTFLQMAQPTLDSKSTEPQEGNRESDLPCGEKQLPIAAKKTALRELQNENRVIAPSSIKSLSSLKDPIPTSYPNKVAGTKRLPPPPSSELSVSPLRNLSPCSNYANSQFVYVRRKSETETARGGTGDQINITPNHLRSAPVSVQQETLKLQSQLKEPRLVYHSAFTSIPYTSPVDTSTKPSDPFPLGVPVMKKGSSGEPKYGSGPSARSPMGNTKVIQNLHWEKRYEQLQKLLNDLKQADHKDYLQSKLCILVVHYEVT